MRIRYVIAMGITLAFALGCTQPVEPRVPGDALVGTWSSPEGSGWPIQLAATAGGADLGTPCTTAHFPALRLDDSLHFQARGVVTAAGGLVPAQVGDSTTITGRADGVRVIVGAFTLVPGSFGHPVCNA